MAQARGTIAYQLLNLDGTGAVADLELTATLASPDIPSFLDVDDQAHILRTLKRPLDKATGAIAVDVPASDGVDIDPQNITYHARVITKTGKVVVDVRGIFVPTGGVVQLANIAPNPQTSPPTYAQQVSLADLIEVRARVDDLEIQIAGVGGGSTGVDSTEVQAQIDNHVNSTAPHPVYDDIQRLDLIFENGLI